MDCVKACPHDNVAIYAMSPMREITRDPLRSGIRRLSSRIDIAFVILIVVLSAFLNAAAMIGPGVMFFSRIGSVIPSSLQPAAGLLSTCIIAITFAALLWIIAMSMRKLFTPESVPTKEIFSRFALALLPLGLGMWSAHLLFHALTTWSSAIPLVQQFAHDLGLQFFNQPNWSGASAMAGSQSLLGIQLFLLDAGLVLTLYAGWRLAHTFTSTAVTSLRLMLPLRFMLPWSGAVAALYLFGFWILLQPMQMRGMVMQG
jgi:hypothetical protein